MAKGKQQQRGGPPFGRVQGRVKIEESLPIAHKPFYWTWQLEEANHDLTGRAGSWYILIHIVA